RSVHTPERGTARRRHARDGEHPNRRFPVGGTRALYPQSVVGQVELKRHGLRVVMLCRRNNGDGLRFSIGDNGDGWNKGQTPVFNTGLRPGFCSSPSPAMPQTVTNISKCGSPILNPAGMFSREG